MENSPDTEGKFPWAKALGLYGGGLLLGLTLVLYPAAGNLFMSAHYQHLSSAQFGLLFLPQIGIAVIASLLAPALGKRIGMKAVLQLGLAGALVSCLLFAASQWGIQRHALAYGLLLAGTSFLGLAYGFTITALNPLVFGLVSGKETSLVAGLHASMGAGTALAPLYLNYFRDLGYWWAAGLLTAVLILGVSLWLLPLRFSMPEPVSGGEKATAGGIPFRVWCYVVLIFLYGICEGTFGNWGSVYLTKQVGLSTAAGALGLSAFWLAVTGGRVGFSFYALHFSTRWLYRLAPLLAAIIFFSFPYVSHETGSMIAMAGGGLALSFFFPNSISRATAEFPARAAIVSGLLVAAIQLGTGLSSNAIGWLDSTVSLATLFRTVSISALIMAAMAWYLTAAPKPSTLKSSINSI